MHFEPNLELFWTHYEYVADTFHALTFAYNLEAKIALKNYFIEKLKQIVGNDLILHFHHFGMKILDVQVGRVNNHNLVTSINFRTFMARSF